MTRSRPLWLRAFAGTAVLCGAPVIAFAFFASFLWWPPQSVGVLGLAVLGVSAIAAMPLFRGRWDREAFVVQGFFTVVLLVAYVAVAVIAVGQAWQALDTRADYGTSAAECATWIAVAGGAVLLAALVCATVPVAISRRLLVRVVGALAVLGSGTAGAAVAIAGTDSCEHFRFDRAAWDRHPVAVAEGLSDCRTLDGMTEDELGRLLGPTTRGYSGTVWIGDSLRVQLAGGRVREAWADSPESAWMD
jgi:hypothetical protein